MGKRSLQRIKTKQGKRVNTNNVTQGSISVLGSCLTLGNELSEETHVLTKQEILLGKGTRVESSRGKGTQENSSATWLAVSGFMVMGLVSGLSLANHSDSESFLVARALFSQDGCPREGFWEVVGPVVSPFDLSRTLLVGGGLFI